jgi:pimeloyl-ACP methyl ester carboxylesterase
MVQANIVIEGDPPVAVLPKEAAMVAVFSGCPDEQAARGADRLRPQPVAPFATPVRVDEAVLASIPRFYVLTGRDNSIPPALQRRMIREHPCQKVIELDTGHAPFFSATDDLVAALLDLAGEPAVELSVT